MIRLPIALILLAAGFPALADAEASLDEQWFAVMLNGAKTGHMRAERRVEENRVITEQFMALGLERMGITISVENLDRYVETIAGEPLEFESVQKTSGVSMTVRGQVQDGNLTVVSGTMGSEQTRSMKWPEGALLAEGQRLATLDVDLEPGTEFTVTAFVPSAMEAVDVHHRVESKESVDLFGREIELIRIIQAMKIGMLDTETTAWVDPAFELQKMTMSVMGLQLEIKACPKQCALSDNEPTEFFTNALATSPTPITDEMLATGVVYTLSARSDDVDIHFPQSAEQTVSVNDGNWTLRVARQSPAATEFPYQGSDPDLVAATKPTNWMQSDAPAIQQAARDAAANAKTAAEAMRALEGFVAGYVNDKSLSVGYASALEVLETKAGDCTEHALLLAAMGRSLGIPTRVATGLAYVDDWVGYRDTFVPHAWAQAWIGDRWISYDAALGGFGPGHIALGYGDGDPWKFYDGALTLGNLRIDSASPGP